MVPRVTKEGGSSRRARAGAPDRSMSAKRAGTAVMAVEVVVSALSMTSSGSEEEKVAGSIPLATPAPLFT